MIQPHNSAEVSEEEAFHFIVRVLRDNVKPDLGSSYGYDVYLPNIVMHYLISVAKRSHAEEQHSPHRAPSGRASEGSVGSGVHAPPHRLGVSPAERPSNRARRRRSRSRRMRRTTSGSYSSASGDSSRSFNSW